MNIYDFAGNEYEWTLEMLLQQPTILVPSGEASYGSTGSTIQPLTAMSWARPTATTRYWFSSHTLCKLKTKTVIIK